MLIRSFITLILLGTSLLYAKELKKGLLERIIQPKLTLKSSYLSMTEIEGGKGSLKVQKNTLRINNKIMGFTYDNLAFSWNDIVALPFGDKKSAPIKEMHSLKFNINAPYFLNKKWFILNSISLRSSFENKMSGSYGGKIFSFASYKINDDHAIQMGAFANYHKISTLALPVLSYSYRARQSDGLQVILGFPRTYIGYYINQAALLKLGIIFSQSVTKLSDDSRIENAGFIEAKNYMGNLGLSYEINRHMRFESNLLYGLKRDFTIFDAQGNEQSSYVIEPSFGASVRIIWLF